MRTNSLVRAVAVGVVLVVAAITFWAWRSDRLAAAENQASGSGAATQKPNTLELSDSQLEFVKVAPVGERQFPVEKEAVGSIDFDEDMAVQVFTPYQGKIITLFAKVGDDVKKGQTLFTIDSPDLLQAESTLIAAAGVLNLTTRNLARLRDLYTTRAVSSTMWSRLPLTSKQPKVICKRRVMPCASLARPIPISTILSLNVSPIRPWSSPARSPANRRPQCGAGIAGAARRRVRSLHGCRHRYDVDAGERCRDRQPGFPCRAAGAGQD